LQLANAYNELVRLTLALCVLAGCGRVAFDPAVDAAAGGVLDTGADASSARMQLVSDAVAYWTFEEGAGPTTADLTGNGHTMTLQNGLGWGTGTVQADGVDDYASVPTIDFSGTQAITVLIEVDRAYTAGPAHTLLELSTNTNLTATGFGLFPDDTFTCGGALLTFVRGNVDYNSRCYPQPSSGRHKLILIYDKSQPAVGEVQLFVDGTLIAPASSPGLSNNANGFGAEPLFLLSRAGNTEFNQGTIFELALWDRALKDQERQLL